MMLVQPCLRNNGLKSAISCDPGSCSGYCGPHPAQIRERMADTLLFLSRPMSSVGVVFLSIQVVMISTDALLVELLLFDTCLTACNTHH